MPPPKLESRHSLDMAEVHLELVALLLLGTSPAADDGASGVQALLVAAAGLAFLKHLIGRHVRELADAAPRSCQVEAHNLAEQEPRARLGRENILLRAFVVVYARVCHARAAA